MSLIFPMPCPLLVHFLLRPWPGRFEDRRAAHGGALLCSGRRATGRWSRGTPGAPGCSGRSEPATQRSPRVTTCRPAWPPLWPEAAGSRRSCTPSDVSPCGGQLARLSSPDSPGVLRWRSPPGTPSTVPARGSRRSPEGAPRSQTPRRSLRVRTGRDAAQRRLAAEAGCHQFARRTP